MLVDSHCHLDRIDLAPYNSSFADFMEAAAQQEISHMLSIAIDMENYDKMVQLVEAYPQISITVGVHPNENEGREPTVEELVELGQSTKVVGIGETGLDYFRSEGDLAWQKQRFRDHIRAAKVLEKPLIVHTRDAREDTLAILREEGADKVGGVIHCFTEDWVFAQQAMEMGFYISFSGIVTFNNAKKIREVAEKIPANRFLIETDSPYLAPVPFRGKPNYPMYVRHVADCIAELRRTNLTTIASQSADNFHTLFKLN